MSNFQKQRNLLNGSIIQSVYSSNSYQTTTTGTTYTDILSALGVTWEIAITPKSASSVINLMANFQVQIYSTVQTVNCGIRVQRKIGAGAYSTIYTPVSNSDGPLGFGGVFIAGIFRSPYILTLRDSPATTDVVTYKFQFTNINFGSPISTINVDSTTDGQSFVFLNEVAVIS